MKNKLEYIFFVLFEKIFSVLGLKLSRKFATPLACLFYYLIPIRKQTVLENLRNAFPEYSENRIRKIAFGSYKSFSITLIEILCMKKMDREEIKRQVICKNNNLIHEKSAEEKGVIMLSAHFGNWEYIAASIAAQVELSLSIIVKNQRNGYVNEWMNNVRTRWGNKVVPLGTSIRQTYKELLDKKVVALVADQRGPREGIRVDFFGRKAAVYSGPAALALKTGAPIIYGIPIRQPDYSYKAELIEISKEGLPEDEEEKIIELSQRHTSYLESVIRKYPEQWLWMHKRWKY